MKTCLAPMLFLALLSDSTCAAIPIDHREFEATLNAPYRGDGGLQPDARTFTLSFDYPGLPHPRAASWRLQLLASSGRLVARWEGSLAGQRAPSGIYHVRLHAAMDGEDVEQDWDIEVGKLPAPALPYTVYYGNLHSQSNHSDGGGPLDSCTGAQNPQSAPFGPDTAYAYAHGLDLLMVSEHNHMYDGSDGTKLGADPARGKALYQAGLRMALHGMEWGVIGKGGHLNIFNSDELLGWETNAKGELPADTLSPRSDYAALYTLMNERGWVGQFNHPAQSGQFVVNGKPLAYTPDGDAVMALCEVVNSTAFSSKGDESETRRSNFEQACNALLEAGYHVAFSSDQDNHCANWGMSYTNRTAVLIPNGVPLTRDSVIAALRARRVFATMDRNAQLVLVANGHLMGERFDNDGALNLKVLYAGAPGRGLAQVAIMEASRAARAPSRRCPPTPKPASRPRRTSISTTRR